jgi:hypothetical protein
MSSGIENFGILYNNAFRVAPVLINFFSALGPISRGYLLSYLALPLVFHPASQAFLVHANSRSSVVTFAKRKEGLYGLPDRISSYKQLTCTSVQYLHDLNVIHIDKSLAVFVLKSESPGLDKLTESNLVPPHVMKAAARLGKLFSALDVPTSFRFMGIRQL